MSTCNSFEKIHGCQGFNWNSTNHISVLYSGNEEQIDEKTDWKEKKR